MGMHIDETRRNDPPTRVNPAPGSHLAEITDGGDAVARDRDIGAHSRGAGAVDHVSAREQNIAGTLCRFVHEYSP